MAKQQPQNKPDRWTYCHNRSKWMPEDLRPYEGHWVAWSLDGASILAHHEHLDTLLKQLDQSGVDREDFILDRIPLGGVPETIL